MKKLISFMLGTVMLLSLTACGNNQDQSVQSPNPFTECTTMEEAAQIAGFDLSVPDSIDGIEKSAIRVNKDGKLFEVIYDGEDEKIVIRKAESNEDVSGDYTKYEQVNAVNIGNKEVTMKGNSDNISVALWKNEDYSYSIASSTGLSKTTMTDLVHAVDEDNNDINMIGGDPATWGSVLDSDENTDVEIPNPFTEYNSMDEAAKAAGFALAVPEIIDGYEQPIIRTMTHEDNGAMIEVIYYNNHDDKETDEKNEIRIRKATGNEDISGDYTQYAESNVISVGDIQVAVKGENGQIQLATWISGDYTYSLGFYSGAGISSEDLNGFITSIH